MRDEIASAGCEIGQPKPDATKAGAGGRCDDFITNWIPRRADDTTAASRTRAFICPPAQKSRESCASTQLTVIQ
jgi:hypothetical protein